MKMILTIFALIFLMSGSYAQQCGSEEANKRIQKEYPNSSNYSITYNKKDRGDSLIIIPVVFHVLHEGGPENISDAQVESAIIAMNEVFQHRHGDTASIDPDFKGRVVNQTLEPTTEEFKWMIPATVKAGYYIIQLNDGQVSWTEKIVVF